MSEYSVIGKSVPRLDALDKVTGKTIYNSDKQAGTPGLLYGKMLTSPYAHAKIISIDTSAAERVPGVVAVVTGKDAPEVRYGFCVSDQYIPARDVVRFVGETVAAVAAESPEIAEKALKLIKVQYQELPAVFDVEEAFTKKPPAIIHPQFPQYKGGIYEAFSPIALDPDDYTYPNVNGHRKTRKGDIEKGFKEADLIVENKFVIGRMTHAQLEPHNCVAQVDSSGTLLLWTSLQCIYRVRAFLCRSFKLPASKVRVISAYIGGAFGGFPKVEQVACLLAFKTGGRPVKILLTREEVFTLTNFRAPNVIYLKDGVKKDGTLVAREMKLIIDSGAFAEFSPMLCRQGLYATVPLYDIPNCKMDAWSVYTNSSASGPLRGAGVPQPNWAIESQMDIIAEKLGMDPVELRRKNLLKEGEKNILGEVMSSMRATECLDRAAEWIGWGKASRAKKGHIKIGRGIALGSKCSVPVASCATVKVCGDGTLTIFQSVDEIGQGTFTVLAQIAAEEFGVPVAGIKIVQGDTAITPYAFGSVGSVTTYHTGNAVKLACQDAKRQLFELASTRMGVPANALEIKNGKIFARGSPSRAITVSSLFSPLIGGEGVLLPEGGEIVGRGTFTQVASPVDPETGQAERANAYYSEGAQAVEVAVDTETGQVEVLRMCSVFNMGQPINPKLCEGQMESGILMGIGSTLYEEVVQDKGRVCNPNFTDYRVPSIKQMPRQKDVASFMECSPHPEGPYGAKAIGEGSFTPAAPAIASAIYNAVGIRAKYLPITPERVLKGIEESGKSK